MAGLTTVGEDLRALNEAAAGHWLSPDRAADTRLVVAVLAGAVVLLVQHYLVIDPAGLPRLLLWLGFEQEARGLYRAMTAGEDAAFLTRLIWASGIIVCLLIVPAMVLKASGGRLSDHGMRLDRSGHGWLYLALFAVMLPLVAVAALQPGFRAYYPLFRPEAGEGLWPRFTIWETVYVLQFVAVEFFFRGYLLHSAKHRFGAYAILLPLIPYVMVHFGKPPAEAAGSIVAGLVLGYLSLRTGSIVYGVALHAGIALAMDALALMLGPTG